MYLHDVVAVDRLPHNREMSSSPVCAVIPNKKPTYGVPEKGQPERRRRCVRLPGVTGGHVYMFCGMGRCTNFVCIISAHIVVIVACVGCEKCGQLRKLVGRNRFGWYTVTVLVTITMLSASCLNDVQLDGFVTVELCQTEAVLA